MKTLILILVAIFLTCSFAFSSDSLKVVYPNGGEAFKPGDKVTIKWEGVPAKDTVSLYYSIDRGFNWTLISKTASGLRYEWDVPNVISKYYLIKVERPDLKPAEVFSLGNIVASSLNSNKTLLAVAYTFGRIYIYDILTNRYIDSVLTERNISCISWSKYEDYLFISFMNREIEQWNVKTKTCVTKFKSPLYEIYNLKETSDGRYLLGAFSGFFYKWDKVSGDFNKVEIDNTYRFDYYNDRYVFFRDSVLAIVKDGISYSDTLIVDYNLYIKILEDKLCVFRDKELIIYSFDLKQKEIVPLDKTGYDIVKLNDTCFAIRTETGFELINLMNLTTFTSIDIGARCNNIGALSSNKLLIVSDKFIKTYSLMNNIPVYSTTSDINTLENIYSLNNIDGAPQHHNILLIKKNSIVIYDTQNHKILKSIKSIDKTKPILSGDGKKVIYIGSSIIYDIEVDEYYDMQITLNNTSCFNNSASIYAQITDGYLVVYASHIVNPMFKIMLHDRAEKYKIKLHPEKNIIALYYMDKYIRLYNIEDESLILEIPIGSINTFLFWNNDIIIHLRDIDDKYKLVSYNLKEGKLIYSIALNSSNSCYFNFGTGIITIAIEVIKLDTLYEYDAYTGKLINKIIRSSIRYSSQSDNGMYDVDAAYNMKIYDHFRPYPILTNFEDPQNLNAFIKFDYIYLYQDGGLLKYPLNIPAFSNDFFSVETEDSVNFLRILTPTSRSLIHSNDTILISWEPWDDTSTYSIDYSLDSGRSWINLTIEAKEGRYLWNLSGIKPSTSCLLRIEKNDANKKYSNRILGTGRINNHQITPNGGKLLFYNSGYVFVYDANTLEPTDTIGDGSISFYFGSFLRCISDSTVLIRGKNDLQLWNIEQNKLINKIIYKPYKLYETEPYNRISYSNDNTKCALYIKDSVIAIFDTYNLSKIKQIKLDLDSLESFQFIQKDKTLFIRAGRGYHLLDVASGNITKSYWHDSYFIYSFIDKYNYFVGSGNKNLIFFDEDFNTLTTLENFDLSAVNVFPYNDHLYFINNKCLYIYDALTFDFISKLTVADICFFDKEHKYLYYKKDTLFVKYDFINRCIYKTTKYIEQNISSALVIPDSTKILLRDGTKFKLLDFNSEKILDTFSVNSSSNINMILCPTDNYVAISSPPFIYLYNSKDYKIKIIDVDNNYKVKLDFDLYGNLFTSTDFGLNKYRFNKWDLEKHLPFFSSNKIFTLNNNIYLNTYQGTVLLNNNLDVIDIFGISDYFSDKFTTYLWTSKYYLFDELGTIIRYDENISQPVSSISGDKIVSRGDLHKIVDKDFNLVNILKYAFISWVNDRLILTGSNGLLKFFYIDGDIVDTSEVFAIEPPVKAEEEKNSAFELYPNPAKDYIKISSAERVSDIEIFDSNGKRIIGFCAAPASGVISTSSMANGSYSVNFKINGKRYSEKFIVIK